MDQMKKALGPVKKMAKRLSGEHLGESVIANAYSKLKNECMKVLGEEQPPPLVVNKEGIKYLPTPNKSPNDKKEYRTVLLPNGLTALLISDVNNLVTLAPEDCSLERAIDTNESEDEAMSEEEDEEEESENEMDESEVEGTKKPSCPEEKLAAVSLTVGVGSFSDPPNIPGLAHFLEHMVFMGSEKFSGENDFDDFVKRHGGYDNASTECEATNFYFECQEKRLLHTMDMFAQFFISPLMKREAMTREREAIESEFQMAVTSDSYRKQQLVAQMAYPSHPATTFTWGNLKTLRDSVPDDELYEAVHKFRARHYSAHRMTVAVQARLPLDVLEDWVYACFSPIPTNYLPPDDFTVFQNPAFDQSRFCKLYTINPVKDVCTMDLTWFMPTLRHHYKVKPTEYVSWFLGHEGKGSLLSLLRQKVWALEITTGVTDSDFDHNSLYCLFTMSLSLTEAGLRNIPHIIEAVFGYIKMLKEKGPQEWLYREMQSIEDARFRFEEEASAGEYVEWLSGTMQIYPPQDYITGEDLFFDYDPAMITECMNFFSLENMNIMISTKKPLDGVEFDQVEPWFGTQYNMRDIPTEWLELWRTATPDPSFSLPEPNNFITTNFDLLDFDSATLEQKEPIKILDNEYMELYHRQDTKFRHPNAFLYIQLVSPLNTQCPYHSVLMDMFLITVKQQMVESLYPARLAQLSYATIPNDRGLNLRCWGFSQKIPMLLNVIINAFCKFKENLNPVMFSAVKEEVRKSYYNNLLRPEKLSKDVRMALLLQTYWTHCDKYNTVNDVTMEAVAAFADKFLDQLYVQCLVQGNVSKDDALEICSSIVKTLKCKPLPPELIPQTRVMQIPHGEMCCRVKSFNTADTNCVTTNYYQSGKATIRDVCIAEMVVMLLEEPLFNILRTREQLGYDVSALTRDTFGILGFSITVVSQFDRFTVDHVDSRIEAFLQTFMKELKKLKSPEFDEVLQSLIKLKQCTDLHLKEEVDRNWEEILNQDYIFDRKSREVEFLKDLKPAIIYKWFNSHVACGNKSNFRKLSVQIEGYSKSLKEDSASEPTKDVPADTEEVDECQSSQRNVPDKFELEFIKMSNMHSKEYFISDINAYKKNLCAYPPHKVVA
ncbi:Nardilysin [Frankliniella fusca]|uniref:Nardilysin n=1 Tax=Frankliniella fusca TaxID=407009 RepID=A0AAE1H577_9NEOP|nr:Nardilysin [Frankliniella fusca]